MTPKGVHRSPETEFKPGRESETKAPIGEVRIRSFSRTGDQRVFVKVADPNVWRLRAHVVWEAAHGPIPEGMGVHHADRNKLNDSPDNLELKSQSDHLAEHRPEFQEKCITALVAARRARRWSTKSATKRTGRPPTYSEEQMTDALSAVRSGVAVTTAARRFGVDYRALRRRAS